LPHEEEHADFGWADNVGRSVVAKYTSPADKRRKRQGAAGEEDPDAESTGGEVGLGSERLFATLQWRHDTPLVAPPQGKLVTANGICRVHLTEQSQKVDRLATVACLPAAGGSLTGLHVLVYGRWLVAMNSDLYKPVTWTLPQGYIGKSGRELIEGKDVPSLPANWTLSANQTAVVRVPEGAINGA
jgi:hypothetical protein